MTPIEGARSNHKPVNLVEVRQDVEAAPAQMDNATSPAQTKEQKALDDAIKSNMDTNWTSVKNVKANRTEAPKGFAKPLREHRGAKGIIGIIQIIIEDSESLIKQDVEDEQKSLELHLASIAKTRGVIASKQEETVMLNQVKSDNEQKKTEAEQQLNTVETEMREIDAFLVIVDNQCNTLLDNFQANQEGRAQEISDTIRAKSVLKGMVEE